MPPSGDSYRRLTREIANLRHRALKAGLDRELDSRLAEVLRDALAMCDSLLQEVAAAQVEHGGLTGQIRRADDEWNQLFDRLPTACVCTDVNGFIVKANDAAAALFSISTRHLDTRLLTHFAEDREQFVRALNSVVFERDDIEGEINIRPRDRAPVPVHMRAVRRTPEDGNTVIWFFQPNGVAVRARGRKQAEPDQKSSA